MFYFSWFLFLCGRRPPDTAWTLGQCDHGAPEGRELLLSVAHS